MIYHDLSYLAHLIMMLLRLLLLSVFPLPDGECSAALDLGRQGLGNTAEESQLVIRLLFGMLFACYV